MQHVGITIVCLQPRRQRQAKVAKTAKPGDFRALQPCSAIDPQKDHLPNGFKDLYHLAFPGPCRSCHSPHCSQYLQLLMIFLPGEKSLMFPLLPPYLANSYSTFKLQLTHCGFSRKFSRFSVSARPCCLCSDHCQSSHEIAKVCSVF